MRKRIPRLLLGPLWCLSLMFACGCDEKASDSEGAHNSQSEGVVGPDGEKLSVSEGEDRRSDIDGLATNLFNEISETPQIDAVVSTAVLIPEHEGNYAGLVARMAQDRRSFLFARIIYSDGNYRCEILSVVNGEKSLIAGGQSPGGSGLLLFEVKGTMLIVSLNNNEVLSATDNSHTIAGLFGTIASPNSGVTDSQLVEAAENTGDEGGNSQAWTVFSNNQTVTNTELDIEIDLPPLKDKFFTKDDLEIETRIVVSPYKLDSEQRLGLTNGGDFFNSMGRNEKWVRAYEDSSNGWYFILETGEIYKWDSTPDVAKGPLIGYVGSYYYENTTALRDAVPGIENLEYTLTDRGLFTSRKPTDSGVVEVTINTKATPKKLIAFFQIRFEN